MRPTDYIQGVRGIVTCACALPPSFAFELLLQSSGGVHSTGTAATTLFSHGVKVYQNVSIAIPFFGWNYNGDSRQSMVESD